jgi:hypothetical protein
MADKLDPFLLGAYKDSIAAATQYVEEAVENWAVPNKTEIISAFTDKYKSHGHPIDTTVLDMLHVPYKKLEEEKECIVWDLHELCMDILNIEKEEGFLIMTEKEYLFSMGDFQSASNLQPDTP